MRRYRRNRQRAEVILDPAASNFPIPVAQTFMPWATQRATEPGSCFSANFFSQWPRLSRLRQERK
jgi:hypothetical protein